MSLLHKSLRLNSLSLGKAKTRQLNALLDTTLKGARLTLAVLRDKKPRTRAALHKPVYDPLRGLGLPSQVACDVVSQVWEARKTAKTFQSIPARFNIPRSGGIATTTKGTPVLTLKANHGKRIAVPVARDGGHVRFSSLLSNGFNPKQIRLCRKNGAFRFWVLLEKEIPDPPLTPDMPVVGVDVGVRSLVAASILGGDGLDGQYYLGRDLYASQRDAGLRRGILQEGIVTGAMPDRSRRGMDRLRGWENRFTTTRCWQMAHQVVDLAEAHHAAIAIEGLKGLREAPGHRKSRRKTSRMPYAKFRSSLESLALERGVPLVAVPPAYTSRRCSRCGEIGKRKGATFRCPRCDYLGNADRNASVNIAKSLRERLGRDISNLGPQYSRREGRVNGLGGKDEGGVGVSSQLYHSPDFKPPVSTGGG